MTAQPRLLGGRYQVGELLGYGGMAEVHRGRDLRLGRDVAIKTLRHDLARDATFQLRFRREAQNAASLNHPAIVAVYDTGEEIGPNGEELPHIVMEFVNGRTLKELLAVEGRLMPRRALEITADICAALEFSHRHSIIHRDIKPGNVMLTRTGQVKVMDFGIARALASGATTMTQTSAVIGTAQYLSPEQARGEAVDARSDVYATGCVLYELLCGHPPFVGDNPVSVAYQHVREDPRAPSETNPDVTPDIDAVVLKALAKNPVNRYQSAAEMRSDVLRAAAGRPVYATPVMRESDQYATSAAGQGPSHLAGPPTRPVARVGDPRRRRASSWVLVSLSVLGLLAVVALAAGLWLSSRDTKVRVPDLSGRNQAQAEQLLTGQGLVGKPENATDPQCTQGQIFGQQPGVGEPVSKGATITYRICVGPGKTTVPPLVGLSQDDAEAALKSANLTYEVKPVDSDKDEGRVLKSTPGSGTQLDVNSKVVIEVSRGNKQQVPSVVGLSEQDAKSRLADAGFKNVDVATDNDADAGDFGKVTKQVPGANSTQKTDAKITIFVGRTQPQQSASPSPSASATTTTPPGGGGG